MLSLIENIQREDLNPIEEAKAFKRLLDEFGLRQEDLAERVSKSRTAITNAIRLLKLDERVQNMVIEEKISMGHARALLSLDDPKQQLKLYNETVKKDLSVRQVEQRAKQMQQAANEAVQPAEPGKALNNKEHIILQKHLTKAFGVPVKFACDQSGKGKITFPFSNEEELEKIIRIFDQLKDA